MVFARCMGVAMGDVIPFPVKKKEPERPVLDERLERIRKRLDEINKLMEKLRNERRQDSWD